MRLQRVLMLACLLKTASTLAACTTSAVSGAPALRSAMGNSLAGAQGKTLADQNKIDKTIAPGCALGLYTPIECDRHTKASADRRAEIAS